MSIGLSKIVFTVYNGTDLWHKIGNRNFWWDDLDALNVGSVECNPQLSSFCIFVNSNAKLYFSSRDYQISFHYNYKHTLYCVPCFINYDFCFIESLYFYSSIWIASSCCCRWTIWMGVGESVYYVCVCLCADYYFILIVLLLWLTL